MSNQIYKIFQVMEFFITKYNYLSVQIKNLVKPNEVFIVSNDNKNYSLIRITNDPILSTSYDNERIDKIIRVLSNQFNIDNSKVLDIHIGNETVNNDEPFKTLCLNTMYYSGEDLEGVFPGIHNIIKESNNEEEAIKSSINNINEAFRNLKAKANKRPLLKKIKEAHIPATLTIISICIILYIISFIIVYTKDYSTSATLIALGGNYKIFILGLKQYYRLITGAFLHSSLTHLFFNMWSFYVVASVIEKRMGSIKMLIMLFTGILFSSLTSGILQGNTLTIGMSGGIYCLFVYIIAYYLGSGFINTRTFIPTILLNLALNFMPGVSWQTHLGGAICGIMFYYIFKNKELDKRIIGVLLILTISLGFKYIKDYNIKPYYTGTDVEVMQIYYDFGLKNYAENNLNKLMTIYNS